MKPRENPDFSNEMPRSMPFTSNHGTDILKLLPSELDVLSTLQSNMEVTRSNLQELFMGKQIFSRFAINRISRRIAYDRVARTDPTSWIIAAKLVSVLSYRVAMRRNS